MEIVVKKYATTSAANRDARRMAAEGWVPQGMTGGGDQYSLSKSVTTKAWASTVLGPLGLFASSKRQQPVTITWTRTPKTAAPIAAYEPVVEAPETADADETALVKAAREDVQKAYLRVKAYEYDLKSRKSASRARGAASIGQARADYDAARRKLADAIDTAQGVMAGGHSLSDELERLSALHRDGALSNDEFQAAKAKLIGSA